ncbi:methyltransferase, partial [Caulobacter sp. D4A]
MPARRHLLILAALAALAPATGALAADAALKTAIAAPD